MPIDKIRISHAFAQAVKNRTLSEKEVRSLKTLVAGDPETTPRRP